MIDGSGNLFVAPVTVGDGAYTAAGSVIISDVPPGALGVSRSPQRNVPGWVKRRRAGTKAAQAAEAAEAGATSDTSSGDDPATPTTGGDTSSE